MGDSIIWAAYAAAIATLAAPAGLGLTTSQAFYINKQNAFAIPVVGTGTVNQLYQNWNVYQFASVVPDNNIAVLTDSGQNYDTAFGVYMDNVVLQVPTDPAVQAQLNATVLKLDTLRANIQATKRKALNDFINDCPNGIDPFTGAVTTLAQYASLYYPEIQDGIKQIAVLESIRFELESTITGGPQLARLKSWREALTNGTRTDILKLGYNMPVLQADESVVINVSNGVVTANNQPTSFVPGWSIGGAFNTVAKQWVDTFPTDYPFNRAKYDMGKSIYSTLTISTTANNWKQFGHSSTTQNTGSDGWIFWSKKSTTTNTWDRTAIRINETSFKKGISVAVWGIGTFPVQMSQWYQGNPKTTFPVLVASATPRVRDEVTRQITSVVMGYGVETIFTLEKTAYDAFTGAISTAKSTSGSLSIFGSLYGTSNGDHSSTYEPWENIKTFSENNTIVLRAQNNKVPMILGTTVTRIAG